MIIGLTGTLAAGKGTVAEYLVDKKGFKHFSVRGYLIDELNKNGLEINRTNLVNFANELRKNNSPSFIVEELFKLAKIDGGNAIIESIRCPGEVDALKQKENFYFLAVDADQKLRYERSLTRASETDNISFEEFVENEKREFSNTDPTKQNLGVCINRADYKLINDTTKENLFNQLEKILSEIGY